MSYLWAVLPLLLISLVVSEIPVLRRWRFRLNVWVLRKLHITPGPDFYREFRPEDML